MCRRGHSIRSSSLISRIVVAVIVVTLSIANLQRSNKEGRNIIIPTTTTTTTTTQESFRYSARGRNGTTSSATTAFTTTTLKPTGTNGTLSLLQEEVPTAMENEYNISEECEIQRRRYHIHRHDSNNDTEQQYHRHHSPSRPPICLVHLGKTAGSTVTCMMNRTVQHSGKGNSGCSSSSNANDDNDDNEKNDNNSAIAHYVTRRVHLEPAPIQEFDSFLITLRNPIDRMISWYYYLHPDYPPTKLPRHKKGCDDFELFFHCWPTLQSFTTIGLEQTQQQQYNNDDYDTDNNDNNNKCKVLAWETATGRRHCWHNYWNYNRTYGPLFLLENTTKTTTTTPTIKSLEVFAIRTEYIWEDWKTVDVMLGGTGELLNDKADGDNGNSGRSKNRFSESTKNITLDPQGRDNLCRALCHEIQLYKRLIQLSINLCPQDKKQSLAELKESCPNEDVTRIQQNCQ